MKKWKLNSWKNYPVKHIPTYEDEKELNIIKKIIKKIKRFVKLINGAIIFDV